MKNLIQKWNSINLIKRIICGLIVGIILGLAIPQASVISILGDLFVGDLAEVGTFREEVTDQTVGVLVRAPLPGRVRITEEHLRVGGHREPGMLGHLAATVPGQRLP